MSVSDEQETEEQRPRNRSVCQTLRRDAHAKCLVLTLLLLGCLVAVVWCRLAQVTRLVVNFQSFPITTRRRVSPCDEGYVYIPLAFMAMLYVVYLVECWHCSTRLALTYRVDASSVYSHIRQMRDALPVIWWKAICYHYVRRSRQVTRYRNGDAYTTTQTYYERVNSHAAGSCFVYSSCGSRDISKTLTDLEKFAAIKIRFSKGFAFANLEAAGEFEDQRSRFFQNHERLDDYMEMREGLDLVGVNFQEYMVAFADKGRLPWYVSQRVFWALSIALLSWPLRLAIEWQTAYVHYRVTKLFGGNYSSPSQPMVGHRGTYLPGRLSMDSAVAVDNSDLERHITSNFTLAPSYSEALLLTTPRGGGGFWRTDSNGNIPVVNGEDHSRDRRPSVWRWAATRFSWRRGGGGDVLSRPRRHSATGRGIPVSLSRVSFENGHVVYVVSPFSSRTNRPSLRRTFTCPQGATSPDPDLPSYEDCVWLGSPTVALRRSLTDQDFRPTGSPLVASSSSCRDFEETSL